METTLLNTQYPGLELGLDDSFRLIQLQPGKPADPVTVRLINARLSDPPSYEALSYAWGDITRPSEIVLSDAATTVPFLVTANCHAALVRLRSLSTTRTLWIDSICINQALVPERNHQLSLMPRIYSTAVRVVAYIGEPADGSDEAMDWIREVDAPSDYGTRARYDDAPKVLKPDRDILRALLGRRWFHRIWVLQEITLSADAVVICGSKEVPWEAFCAFRFWNTNTKWLDTLPYLVQTSLSHVRGNESFQWSQPYSQRLLKKLVATRHCGATDARDKVYAILPLLDWEAKRWSDKEEEQGGNEKVIGTFSPPEVDYASRPAAVFTDLAVRLIQTEGLKVIREVVTGQSVEGLPSWVPDWSVCAADAFLGQSRGAQLGRRPRPLGLTDITPADDDSGSKYGFSTYETATEGLKATQMHIRVKLIGKILSIGDKCDIYDDYFPTDQWRGLITDPKHTAADRTTPCPQDADWETRLRWELNTLSPFDRTLANDEIVYVDAIRTAIRRVTEFNQGKGQHSTTEKAKVPLKDILKGMALSYEIQAEVIFYACHGKRFFVTDSGHIGLAPATSQVGDLVVALEGGPVPFVLRSHEGGDNVKASSGCPDGVGVTGLVGECYAHGVQVAKLWDAESNSLNILEIVIR